MEFRYSKSRSFTRATPNPKIQFSRLQNMPGKAIVMGGSIAGYLAARVLSEHFKEVVVIEKDSYTDDNSIRSGIPQANHVHILLVRGREILEDFFPNLEKELLKAGANKIDFLNDSRYRLPSGWAPKFDSGLNTFVCTRMLLENTIRQQIQKISKIKIEEGKQITSFVAEKSNKISLKTKENEEIQGDLIVDCTGRNTKTPTWLEHIGFPKPRETRIDSFVRYATRRYIPPKKDRKWKMLVILNNPTTNPRIGGIYPIEDGKWLCRVILNWRRLSPYRGERIPGVYKATRKSRALRYSKRGIVGLRYTDIRYKGVENIIMRKCQNGLRILLC